MDGTALVEKPSTPAQLPIGATRQKELNHFKAVYRHLLHKQGKPIPYTSYDIAMSAERGKLYALNYLKHRGHSRQYEASMPAIMFMSEHGPIIMHVSTGGLIACHRDPSRTDYSCEVAARRAVAEFKLS